MLEVSPHLGSKPVRETSEETPAAGEDNVAQEHLTEVVVTLLDRGHDQGGYRLRQVWVRRLRVWVRISVRQRCFTSQGETERTMSADE